MVVSSLSSNNELVDLKNENKKLVEQIKVLKEIINDLFIQNNKLIEQNRLLTAENQILKERIVKLENQINKNSKNSSKPPSSDGFKKKTKTLREKSGKKPGGQKGHEGRTLELCENPDEILIYKVEECDNCKKSLENIEVDSYIIRQVVDIPEIKPVVVEHRAEIKMCPKCGAKNTAKFPENVVNTVQYGENVQSIGTYLTNYQLIPYKRGAEVMHDLFGINLSQGTLVNFNTKCYANLETIENSIKEKLINESEVVHFDETGLYIDKIRNWLHVASNSKFTYYRPHKKRGGEATDDIKILPLFKGVAVHDFWKTYLKYTACDHSFCGAHILRELNAVTELEKQSWAEPMKDLMVEIKNQVDNNSGTANALVLDRIKYYEEVYDTILREGLEEDFLKNIDIYSNRKRKKSTSLKLLNRLSMYKKNILYFMYDFDVPFDNNLAERDLRMMKVKQKISGTFRSEDGANGFARIRGYISTVKKQGENVFNCIKSTFTSKPFDPTTNSI
jgi:transposase/regulator of replication initiation timing